MEKSIRVFAPATVANVACGFDILGFAVNEPGDEVIVQEGVLRGVRGIVRERRSGRQLVIWVAEIGRGVAFTIGSALVRGTDQ